uniref:Uncharacterized protein MANES_13G018200 n=1 Tax=Rhizophora mucronata TaxID=61149 RepID=A0A2P2M3U8_RHIMU
MSKMDAELEKRNKKELEEKAKEMELKAQEEKAARSADLSEVQERLDKLEETVKQVVVEPKKQVGGKVKENQDCSEKKHLAQTTRSNTDSRSEPSKSPEKDHHSEKRSVEGTPGTVSTPISGASRQDQKQKSTDGATSKDQ